MISIIIPVYNAEPYLQRCLDSVLNQTYTNWEAICVDDGSKDQSAVILAEYAKKDGRIKIITQQNGGAAKARNTGLREAKGEYIFFLDSDDELVVNCLELMSKEVYLHPGVEMVVGSHKIMGSNVDKTYNYCKASFIDNNKLIRFNAFKDDNCFNIVPWNRLISLEFLNRESIRFKEGIIHEDDHWAFYIYKKLNTLAVLNEITYQYYVTPNSVMSTNTSKKRGETLFIILCDWVNSFDEPMRALQVFKSLEYYINFVLPFVSRNKNKRLYFSFFFELMRIRKIKIAFYWLINWFYKFKQWKLYHKLIPEAYRAEGEEQAAKFSLIN